MDLLEFHHVLITLVDSKLGLITAHPGGKLHVLARFRIAYVARLDPNRINGIINLFTHLREKVADISLGSSGHPNISH